MNGKKNDKVWFLLMVSLITMTLIVTSCTSGLGEQNTNLSETSDSSIITQATTATNEHKDEDEKTHDNVHEEGDVHETEAEMLLLPELYDTELNGAAIRVIATTSIIGDVVAQVGGAAIDLTVLMEPGQDPHSYEPAAQDFTTVSSADVIFVNGWDLEENLVNNLENSGGDVLIIPISANIAPLAFAEGEHDEHDEEAEENHQHNSADPHVWFSVHNVEQWVENVENVLSDLDPANSRTYEANAAAYKEALEELEAYAEGQLDTIPAENRFLVTNHDSFGYFAAEYGFNVLGTVIPSMSTLAEPSASDLTDLIAEMEEHNACTIFTETTVADVLAQTVADELDGCNKVQVLKLYTGTIGPEESNADTYIGMFRANVDTIVAGLK